MRRFVTRTPANPIRRRHNTPSAKARLSQRTSPPRSRVARKGPSVISLWAFWRRSAGGQPVAEILGFRFAGFFAWWLWRTIYLMKLPSFEPQGPCRRGLDAGPDLSARHRAAQGSYPAVRRWEAHRYASSRDASRTGRKASVTFRTSPRKSRANLSRHPSAGYLMIVP